MCIRDSTYGINGHDIHIHMDTWYVYTYSIQRGAPWYLVVV